MNRRLISSASAIALAVATPSLAFAGDFTFDTSGGATASFTANVDGVLTFGDVNGGQLVTQSSGNLGGRKTIIGNTATSSGNVVTIDGSATSFGNTVPSSSYAVLGPALTIGFRGANNQMVVSGGADVVISPVGGDQSNDVVIGYQAASGDYAGSTQNDLTVTGAGSTFSTASATPLSVAGTTLYLGYGGNDNTIHVLDGGSLAAYQMRVGGGTNSVSEASGTGGSNRVTVDGSGSDLTVQGTLNLGAATGSSDNAITLSDGAHATIGRGRATKALSIGYATSANDNLFLVTGDGSLLDAYEIKVGSGYNSGNTLQIHNGGAVTADVISFNAESNFTVDANYSATAPLVVSGTATIEATSHVILTFSDEGEFRKRTTLISAGTSVTGTFGTLDGSNLAPGFDADLAYDDKHVYLDLESVLGADLAMGQNQSNVATSLNSYFNGGGALPASFMAVYYLSGASLNSALTELSGETATGAQQAAYRSTSGFLGSLTQDFGPQSSDKAVVWGHVDGNYSSLDGNKTFGNNGQTSTDGAVTLGVDFNLANETVLGLSVSGGGTSWTSDNDLGSGDVRNLGFGLRAHTNLKAAYVAAALGYGQQSVAIERDVFGDTVKSDYTGKSLGGRLEAGLQLGGFTPYAAIQSVSFHTPTYSETGSDTDFALTFNDTTARKNSAELGARIAGNVTLTNGSIWTNQAQFAWIHNSLSDDGLTAGFSALPGTEFAINGATEAQDVARVSLTSELRIHNDLVVNALVSSELVKGAQSFTLGTGLAYSW